MHKESIAVAYVAQAHGAEVLSRGTLGTRQCDIDKLIRPLRSQSKELVFVYEAGPCGSWLSRSLMNQGSVCWVVAPSWLPKKSGDRVTTDRRDARPRARLRRSGDLTPVSVPAVDEEARRDLSRVREETLRDLKAAKLRRKACCLRHALRATGRANGRPAHRRWLRAVGGPTPAPQIGLQKDLQTVTEPPARLGRLALARPAPVHTWRCAPVVEARQARRGGQGPVAVTTVAALGDLTRCENPRQLMHDLGLTPSDYARGGRRQQGSLPKPGPPPARRALVAGAWASRYPAQGSRHLQRRLAKLPKVIQALSGKAQGRRCPRERQLLATGQKAHPVVVAMARELSAFLWASAKQVPVPPKAERWRWMDRSFSGFQLLSAEAQPRCGVTLGGVMRPTGILGPRMRQAPDGGQAGGSQPTESSVINRRLFLAPARPIDQGEKT